MPLEYKPHPEDTLGSYLRRLRELASERQDQSISLSDVANESKKYGKPYAFTKGWLSDTEADKYNRANSDKLRTLAQIYSGGKMVGETIYPEWLLALAGYPVIRPGEVIEPPPELLRYLQHSEVAIITWIVGRLAEAGHHKGVGSIRDLAERLHQAYFEKRIEELLSDEDISQQLREIMRVMRL